MTDATSLELYFDTIKLDSGLAEARIKTGTQNKEIYDYLKSHPETSYSPSELWKAFNMIYPLTSFRRSLTCLTEPKYGLNLLVKTGEKRIGIFGSLENCWKIK